LLVKLERAIFIPLLGASLCGRVFFILPASYRGESKGKTLDGHAPLPHNERYLSRIERVESYEGEGRGKATLSPCTGGSATEEMSA